MSRRNPPAPPDAPLRTSHDSPPPDGSPGGPPEVPLQRLLPWVDLFYKLVGMLAALAALWRILHG